MKEGEKIVGVVDGGGRGHTLAKGYSQSNEVGEILMFPGREYMQHGIKKPVQAFSELKTASVIDILNICEDRSVDLVDVAQDNAVEIGLVDVLEEAEIPVVGPTRAAGQIEWDKVWARRFGEKYDLPQPFFKICASPQQGSDFINSQPDQKWVIKAAGLTQGKGVYIARNRNEARASIKKMANFGVAGETFLIEEFLEGEEFSSYAVCDGKNFRLIGHAQDYKKVYDDDQGDNTGGMGSIAPTLAVNSDIEKQIDRVFDLTFKGLSKEERPYKGILYLGGIIVNGHVYVIEFNARWGDPEAQVIIPSLRNDLFKLGLAVSKGDIDDLDIKLDGKVRVAIAGASKGYPHDYSGAIRKQIFGLDDAERQEGIEVYGAGIKVEDGKDFVDGGRLFYIVGEGKNVIEARERAYEAMRMVRIDGNNLHYRKDIGWRDVQRLRAST